MKLLQALKSLFVFAILGSACQVYAGTSAPACTTFYSEVGEAGDRFSPQNISGGSFCGIEGDVGGKIEIEIDDGEGNITIVIETDTSDAFKFFFTGGFFSGIFSPSSPTSTVAALIYEFFCGVARLRHCGS